MAPSHKKFFRQAKKEFHQGKHRDAADTYVKAFRAAPMRWEYRYHVFHGYASILKDKFIVPDETKDILFLETLMKNKHETCLVCSQAAFVLGILQWYQGDRNEAAAFYRDAIRLGTKASKKERSRRIVTNYDEPRNGVIMGEQSVGEVMDAIVKDAKFNLAGLENREFGKTVPGELSWHHFLRADGTYMPSTSRTTCVMVGSFSTELTKEQSGHLLSVGGATCDHCGKSREEAGVVHFNNCSRCKMTYYCDRHCQKQQWRAGHKQHCRKPGQIETGDYVVLKDLVSKPELNGTLVQVCEFVPSSERFAVKVPGGKKTIAIKASNMKLLRPLK